MTNQRNGVAGEEQGGETAEDEALEKAALFGGCEERGARGAPAGVAPRAGEIGGGFHHGVHGGTEKNLRR